MTLFGARLTKGRVLVAAIIVAILMTVPTLRRIVWWLLPLGSGNDDIIGGLALIIIFVIVFVEIWTQVIPNRPLRKRIRKDFES